ncbi:hypothetical protein LPJ63_003017 [Coemansia sp. RSA 2711]|nr:hypothetical protein LPJ63_003017 [Coemansia sp. RSA 2711]KAJ2307299.1 hypothetical protein IWW54_004430 [Coemansia sp. RSA 2705]KAJ2359898.1 hypothetical protein H4S01_005965 [Coemansia sp. RSA 2610]KAJ2369179.1 hypothetical protein H4S02_009983 [Coemansia sp. RSA 2611]
MSIEHTPAADRPPHDDTEAGSADSHIAALASARLGLTDDHDIRKAEPVAAAGLSPSATSMLRVLLPSLSKLDTLLESVWTKQDSLNEVLNRLAAELDQFDELVLPPGVSQAALAQGAGLEQSPATMGQQAALRLKELRARILNINTTLKKVRARLDNVSMLAQAKILQQQRQPASAGTDS